MTFGILLTIFATFIFFLGATAFVWIIFGSLRWVWLELKDKLKNRKGKTVK